MAILVHHFLGDSAHRFPGKTALIVGDAHHTFTALDVDSDQIAGALQRRGIRRGDRVALMLDNSAEFVAILFGILKAGAVFVPINPTTRSDKLAWLLNDSGVRGLAVHAAQARAVRPALALAPTVVTVLWVGGGAAPETVPAPTFTPALTPVLTPAFTEDALADILGAAPATVADPGLIDQDLCAILYTSGSTGRPKGVMLTHRNMVNTAGSIATYLGNTPDDVVLCVLPLSFGYGLCQVITGARTGFTVVLERSFAYPADTLHRMVRHRVTGLPGVPTVFATLLPMDAFATADLSALRYLTNAGAAFPPAHIRRLQRRLPQAAIFSMYGLTECTRVGYLDPGRLHDKITSVGKVMPNSETWIVDDDGRPVPPGTVGELVVRGANVMRGYWGRPAETAERLRDGPIPGEKVLYSGDLFQADAEGFLYFVGRKDDIFKCKGEKVSPKEIENVLYELDSVAEAAVIGVADPLDGMAIKAVVVPQAGSGLTEAAIRQHCRARLESRLLPRLVEIRDALPKTDSGKIRRAALATAE